MYRQYLCIVDREALLQMQYVQVLGTDGSTVWKLCIWLDVTLWENQWLCSQRNFGCFLWTFDKHLIGKNICMIIMLPCFTLFFSISFIEVLLMRQLRIQWKNPKSSQLHLMLKFFYKGFSSFTLTQKTVSDW